MHRAEKVLCMTSDQKNELIKRFPWAVEKIVHLNQQQDILEPAGVENEHYVELAYTMQQHISNWLIDMGFINLNPQK